MVSGSAYSLPMPTTVMFSSYASTQIIFKEEVTRGNFFLKHYCGAAACLSDSGLSEVLATNFIECT